MSKNRTRNNDVRLRLNDDELEFVKRQMQELNLTNRCAYLRKVLLNPIIYNIDVKPIAETSRLVRISANNINQIAKRANESGSPYEGDVRRLQIEIQRLKELIIAAYDETVSIKTGIKR